MMAFPLTLFLAAAWSGAGSALPYGQELRRISPGDGRTIYTIRDAEVTAIVVPSAGSGIFHFLVVAQLRGPGPAFYEASWTYFGGDQFIPRVGSVCTFAARYGMTGTPGPGSPRPAGITPATLLVEGYACDTGQDRHIPLRDS
jgi:hypothetical protein